MNLNYRELLVLYFLSISWTPKLLKRNLIDKKYNPHKSFANTKLTPVSGGLVFLITCLIFIPSDMFELKVSLFFIFLVGFFSDTNYLVSPIKRFVLQIIVILLFIFFRSIKLRVPFEISG